MNYDPRVARGVEIFGVTWERFEVWGMGLWKV